jgi:hypothetical protein
VNYLGPEECVMETSNRLTQGLGASEGLKPGN